MSDRRAILTFAPTGPTSVDDTAGGTTILDAADYSDPALNTMSGCVVRNTGDPDTPDATVAVFDINAAAADATYAKGGIARLDPGDEIVIAGDGLPYQGLAAIAPSGESTTIVVQPY